MFYPLRIKINVLYLLSDFPPRSECLLKDTGSNHEPSGHMTAALPSTHEIPLIWSKIPIFNSVFKHFNANFINVPGISPPEAVKTTQAVKISGVSGLVHDQRTFYRSDPQFQGSWVDDSC